MRRHCISLALLVGLTAGGCFDGAGSLGGACEQHSDCGGDQTCSNGICSLCGNGRIDAGEVCFGATFDAPIGGVAQSLLPFDADLDGDADLIAGVNSECRRPFELDPLKTEIYPCWRITVAINRDAELGFDAYYPSDEESNEGYIESFVLANFDGDEVIDAAVVQSYVPVVVLLPDVGDDSSTEEPSGLLLPEPGFTPRDADFNLDGYTDLALSFDGVPSVGVALAAGDGSLLDVVTTPAPEYSRLVTAADITSDGIPDLLAVSALDGVATRFAGLGDGTFQNLGSVEIVEGTSVTHATTGDIDQDGLLDLVIVDAPQGLVYVLLGLGEGDFALAAELDTELVPTSAVVDDLNVDGRPDLIISNAGADKLTFWINREGTVFEQVDYDVSLNPNAILRADYNGDGISDLVIANANPSMSVVYSSL